MLFHAASFAAEAKRDIWDFSVERSDLVGKGVSSSDLRWLLTHGYVAHAQEISQVGETCRKFRPLRSLAIPEQACFVLTNKGVQLASQGKQRLNLHLPQPSNGAASLNNETGRSKGAVSHPSIPHWDATTGVLSFKSQPVKRFRRPAPSQQAILNAYQENGWPPRIDNPISQECERVSSRRLLDAIRALNRHHEQQLIRFSGDGNGDGVLWEAIDP